VVDRNNQVRWRWLSEPFGTTAPETNPGGLGGFTQNLRFPGQYADQESGLFYNFNRYYKAGEGRYIQSDLIGLAGGINTFTYVAANPLTHVDPSGLIDLKIPGATGDLALHANPGADVTGPNAMHEHPPAHVHLGKHDGPRVRLTDFEPYSESDAKQLTKKQKEFCKSLSNQDENLVRKRAKGVYKRGFFMMRLPSGNIVSSGLVKGGLTGLVTTYATESSPGIACEVDPESEVCSAEE
jgi:RHS repeat-associated protein